MLESDHDIKKATNEAVLSALLNQLSVSVSFHDLGRESWHCYLESRLLERRRLFTEILKRLDLEV